MAVAPTRSLVAEHTPALRVVLVTVGALALTTNCTSASLDAENEHPLPPRTYLNDKLAANPEPDASVDAAPSPLCDLAKPFGAPVPITELNTAEEDYVVDVSPDELTIYVASRHNVTRMQLFSSTRATTASAWGPLTSLFPQGNWDNWSVTVKDNTAVVSSNRSGNNELYIATRSAPLEQAW